MDIRIGKVTHFYNRIGVAVMELTADLKLGDTITLLGHTTDLTQEVVSMEIEHEKITRASAGMEVAIKVEGPVRRGDLVYLAGEE